MSEPVVDVKNLTKFFQSFKAVDNVSFKVYPGEILGLLGPNGAGKTTIIHMLLGLTTPTAGEIKIFGLDIKSNRENILKDINFSSTYVSMPYSLTVGENLKVYTKLYNVKNGKERILALLKTFEMEKMKDKLVRHLSSGQHTRLNLAKALINYPKILFLDEPTASLDPDIADKTRNLLKRIKKESNLSILYTSHNMREMEEMSDRILFLHEGRIIAAGRPEEVLRTFQRNTLEEVFLKVARDN